MILATKQVRPDLDVTLRSHELTDGSLVYSVTLYQYDGRSLLSGHKMVLPLSAANQQYAHTQFDAIVGVLSNALV